MEFSGAGKGFLWPYTLEQSDMIDVTAYSVEFWTFIDTGGATY